MRRNVLRLLAGVLLCLVLASLANAQPAGGGAGGGGAAGGGAAGGGAAGGGAAGGGAAGGGAGGAGAAAATAGPPSQVGRVIFRGTPEEIAAIERILAQHDRLPRQVLLEMYILDVNTRRSDNAGAALQTFFGTARPFGDMPLGAYQFDQRLGDANQSIRFGSLSTERFQLFLNFLKNMTDTRVLNRPSALVMDGGTATVNLGGQEGYVSGYETQSTANVGTSYIPQSSFLNTGQNLTLT
ncbi:MAG: hypothetical protein HY815_19630, partial [Candidatus Riflebacteria bacterium]|nr:hypothetical protein [Candidatus Riflebacteria bacterium]